jgi:predicted permease
MGGTVSIFDRATSLISLLSLFVLGPALGRALIMRWDRRLTWSQSMQRVALGLSTMVVLAAMIAVYGVMWKIHPKDHRLVRMN